MILVIGLVGGHRDGAEPLDHPAADVARDDDADGEAVVRFEEETVLLPGDHDILQARGVGGT